MPHMSGERLPELQFDQQRVFRDVGPSGYPCPVLAGLRKSELSGHGGTGTVSRSNR